MGRYPSWRSIAVRSVVLACLLAGCEARLVPASVRMLDEAEAVWQADPVPNYHIIVDVERPGERRRNDITVQQGQITRAFASYWDSNRGQWEEFNELGKEQAIPFTVPGLFDLVREELRSGQRSDIRSELCCVGLLTFQVTEFGYFESTHTHPPQGHTASFHPSASHRNGAIDPDIAPNRFQQSDFIRRKQP